MDARSPAARAAGRRWPWALCLVLAAAACTEGPPPAGPPTAEPEAAPQQVEVRYPTHDSLGEGQMGVGGRLVIRGDCLLIGNGYKQFPIWPSSTSFDQERQAIVDEDGEIIVRVGGELPPGSSASIGREFAERLAGEELPLYCGEERIMDNMITLVGPWPSPAQD